MSDFVTPQALRKRAFFANGRQLSHGGEGSGIVDANQELEPREREVFEREHGKRCLRREIDPVALMRDSDPGSGLGATVGAVDARNACRADHTIAFTIKNAWEPRTSSVPQRA